MKRLYTVRLTSDDVESSCDFHLTEHGRNLLLEVAAAFNAQARFSVDVRMFVEPAGAKSEEVVSLPGGRHLAVHPKSTCEGQFCCVHNPSDHHMKSWTQLWRGDRALMERLCPEHGIGHPDPDHMAHYAKTHTEGETWAEGVHGCCGCCAPDSAAPQGDAA